MPESAWTLQVLIWFLPFSFVNGVTQYVLIAVDRQRFLTIAFLIATAFNLVANLVLISPRQLPRGSPGHCPLGGRPARAVLVGDHAQPGARVPGHLVWRPAVAAASMAAVVVPLADWNWPLSIPIGAAVYGAVLAAIGGFDADDRALWRRLRGAPG